MHPDDTVDQLASLATFASVPRTELAWLTTRGNVRAYDTGTLVRGPGVAIPR